MKDYGLEVSEQMEQVQGLYTGTGFYIFFIFLLLSMKKKIVVMKNLSTYF